jgi:hypothetical protein
MDKKNPASVMDDLTRRGFSEQFKPKSDGLRSVQSGQTFGPSQVKIVEQYRFEGVSDPDDMSIVYAIEKRNGVRAARSPTRSASTPIHASAPSFAR